MKKKLQIVLLQSLIRLLLAHIDDGLAWQFFFNDEGPQTNSLHVWEQLSAEISKLRLRKKKLAKKEKRQKNLWSCIHFAHF